MLSPRSAPERTGLSSFAQDLAFDAGSARETDDIARHGATFLRVHNI